MKLNVGEVSVWVIVELVEIRQFGADRAVEVVDPKSPPGSRFVVVAQPAGRAGTAAVSNVSA